VDEDDYLMPSPGPMGHNGPFMDLMGEPKMPEATANANARDYLRYLAEAAQANGIGLDNIEYHLMNQEHDYINTGNGQPRMATIDRNSQIPPQNIASPNTIPAVNGGPQMIHIVGAGKAPSSDEEVSDDHDYYNDFDKLQREMQPLNHQRRTANETTV